MLYREAMDLRPGDLISYNSRSGALMFSVVSISSNAAGDRYVELHRVVNPEFFSLTVRDLTIVPREWQVVSLVPRAGTVRRV
jgi:hypothetical protein